MKKMNLWALAIMLVSAQCVTAQNVGINSTGATPNASSMLDVSATDKGVLIPRVGLSGINDVATIASPATSLLIYNTATAGVSPNNVTPGFYYWDGAKWVRLQAGNSTAWDVLGNGGTNPATNYIGTSDNADLSIRTFGTEVLRVTTSGKLGIGINPANTLHVLGNASIGSNTNNVTGTNSFAAGSGNTVSNSYSFIAGGQGSTITGQNDIVGGFMSRAQADHSIVVGYQDTSTSSATGVFGFGTKVTGFTGFATGDRNKVIASNGFASGFNNNANGDGSIVAGQNNTAASYGEAVFGLNSTNYTALGTGATYNIADRIFNIGNGASPASRADAFTILKNGRIGINNASPDGTSKLDITATDKGLLIPRVALTASNAAAPITKSDNTAAATTDLATSLLVYNTTTAGTSPNDVTPGFYYWDGTQWVRLVTSANVTNDWSLTGNAGTSSATNFLGTTDNMALRFRINNQWAGQLDSASRTVSLGLSAGQNLTTGRGNIAIGNAALKTNNNGNFNVAIGDSAGYSINNSDEVVFIGNLAGKGATGTGDFSVIIGSHAADSNCVAWTTIIGNYAGRKNQVQGNVMIGSAAGQYNTTGNVMLVGNNAGVKNTTGTANTFVGNTAGYNNTTGNQNTLLGFASGYTNTTGRGNTYLGEHSGHLNNTGNFNTGVGLNSLYNGSTADSNTAVGYQALDKNLSPANAALGMQSLYFNTAGRYNTSLGTLAMMNNLSGSYNVAAGYAAMINNQSGTQNVAIGSNTLRSANGSSFNVAVGDSSGYAITGSEGVFIGHLAGKGPGAFGGSYSVLIGSHAGDISSADWSTIIGNYAGRNNQRIGNVMIGSSAGVNSTTGHVTIVGDNSGIANTTGDGNSFFGYQTADSTTIGNNNTALGSQAMMHNITGSNNTVVGYIANVAATNLVNASAIGANARVDTSNAMILGSVNGINGAGATTSVGIGTNKPLDRLHVVGNIRMVDGNQAAGRVMISDANGTGSWVDPTALNGYWTKVNDSLYPTTLSNNIGIGTTSPGAPLSVAGTTLDTFTVQFVNNYTGNSTSAGIQNYLTGNGFAFQYAINNNFVGLNTGPKYGIQNNFTPNSKGPQYGINNQFNSTNTAQNYGVVNAFQGRGNSKIGMYNSFGTADSTNFYGTYNTVSNTGNGFKYGSYTYIGNSKLGSHFGSYVYLDAGDSTNDYDAYNELNIPVNAVSGSKINVYNRIANNSTAPFVFAQGILNQFVGTGSALNTGLTNSFNGTGSSSNTGVRNNITSQNFDNTTHIGVYNSLFDAYGGKFNHHYGTLNWVSGNGNGPHVGTLDSIASYGNGDSWGNRIEVHHVNGSTGTNYGLAIMMKSSGIGNSYGSRVDFDKGNSGLQINGGVHYGYYTSDTTSSTIQNHYGFYGNLGGFGNGQQYGSYTSIPNTGSAVHYGNYIDISGGTNQNYGYYANVSAPGSLNTGLYASATGATTNYAAIFNGDVVPNFNSNSALTGYQMGTSSFRWRDIWCWRGVFNGSDIRLKTNIKPLQYGLKELMSIEPIAFTWKADSAAKEKKYELGFSAQQMLKTIPEVVNVGSDSMQTLMMNYPELIPVLVKAIQEQQQMIEELKKQNAELRTSVISKDGNIKGIEDKVASMQKQLEKITLVLGIGLQAKKE